MTLLAPLGCKKTAGTKPVTGKNDSAGGATTEPPGANPVGPTGTDLSETPAAIYNPAIAPSQFELYHVKIGDPASAIPKEGASAPDESGWVNYKQENAFRVENGKVVSLRVSDPGILGQLGINNEQDLANHLKKADETIQASETAPEAEFIYKDRWLELWWNRKTNKVTAIQIDAPG